MQLVDTTMDVLRAHGFTHMVFVANYENEALRREFDADPGLSVTMACREGEAVALASGLVAAGRRTVLCIENLGLFECLDTLRALACDMAIPLPVFVGYCGRGATVENSHTAVGGMTGQLVLAGEWTEPVLAAAKIQHRLLLLGTEEAEARKTLGEAIDAREPFVLLVDTFDRS